jgi:hypothetical protein
MHMMNKPLKLLTLVLGLAASVASAVPTNITVDASGDLLNVVGIASNDQYGQGNNNPESNLAFLQTEIGYWNDNYDPDLPAAVGPVALDHGSLGDVDSYMSVAGYDYVVFHFGNGGAGSPGGWYQAFYLGGQGGDLFEVPAVNGNTVGGFSSARYFNWTSTNVPDNGSTVALVGLSFAAMALLLRRRK